MDNRPVLFIDSGIGGLPYCIDFKNKNPNEKVCYLADNQNFPYGPREKDELTSILITLTEKVLKSINPKIIVLACNTATISALAALRHRYPQIPFVGTVPALKPAAKTTSSGKVGVLGTARTIGEIRSLGLVDETCDIHGIAAPELVDFVENHFEKADEKEKKEIVKKYMDIFRHEGVDSVVLGCTHFLFLQDVFHKEGANPDYTPQIEVFDSLKGITKRIEFLLDENEGYLRAANDSAWIHQLYITLKDQHFSFWKERANTLRFNLYLLNEI